MQSWSIFFVPLQHWGHCYCPPSCNLCHPQVAAKPIRSTCDCRLSVVSGVGDGTTMDICDAILPPYTDILDVRSNGDGNRAPAFNRGNIDRMVANFDNGMWHASGGERRRRGEGGNSSGGSGSSSRKRRYRGTGWGEQCLACFIPCTLNTNSILFHNMNIEGAPTTSSTRQSGMEGDRHCRHQRQAQQGKLGRGQLGWKGGGRQWR